MTFIFPAYLAGNLHFSKILSFLFKEKSQGERNDLTSGHNDHKSTAGIIRQEVFGLQKRQWQEDQALTWRRRSG